MSIRRLLVLLAIAALLGLCALAACTRQKTARKFGYYAGSDACQECHKEHYLGWRATQHPYKLQEASAATVIGDFATNNTYEAGGVTTRMSVKDGAYYVETAFGTENALKSFRVKYVIGALWKQRYVTEFENGALMILPVEWNVKLSSWGDYHGLKTQKPGSGKYWSDPGMSYQFGCMGCHTTGSHYAYDARQDRFTGTGWTEAGVGCEGCHGPGGLHATADAYDKRKHIFHPDRLPDKRRAAMACGYCHTRGKSKDGRHGYPTRGLEKKGDLESVRLFEPGDDLLFTFDAGPGLHPDGSSKQHRQQYNDWLQSRHFTAGVMCWDCHDPHRKDGRHEHAALREKGSALCLRCHTNVASQGIHGIHDVNSCVGCHMPPLAKSANPFDIHAHTLKVVMPRASIEKGGVDKQPNACTLCHYHEQDKLEDLQAVVDRIVSEKKKPKPSKRCPQPGKDPGKGEDWDENCGKGNGP